MPRAGINKAVVQNAREALLARGVHPSVDAIRVELGNTGSKTTIQRYLKELTEPSLPKAVTALRDELVHHVEIVAKCIIEETRLQVATEQPHLDIACQPLTLTEAQNAELITDLQKQLADQRTALENLNRQKHTLEQRCTTLSERNGHLGMV
ncbi:DNA-binding protein [Pseudomonas putida]|uniref:DNA-binding protein n=1 Tax=Pseudomonas putida TaxID=303 RepID=UPI001E4080DD|nr:DNA-binding protein [Pseudomonas putida]MCE0975545.1 DNA-binding protein [Pseudomonas putida]